MTNPKLPAQLSKVTGDYFVCGSRARFNLPIVVQAPIYILPSSSIFNLALRTWDCSLQAPSHNRHKSSAQGCVAGTHRRRKKDTAEMSEKVNLLRPVRRN